MTRTLLCALLLATSLVLHAQAPVKPEVIEARSLIDSWRGRPEVLDQAREKLLVVLAQDPADYFALKEMARYEMKAGYLNDRYVYYGSNVYTVGNYAPGTLARAQSHLNAALKANPKFAEGYVLLGHVQLQSAQPMAAASALRIADELGTSDPWLQLNWCAVYEAIGDYKAIVERAQKVLDGGTKELNVLQSARSYVALGYRQQGMHDKAVAMYQEAIKAEPDDAWLHHNLSNYLSGELGRHDEAIAESRTALRLMNFGRGRLSLAMALYRKWGDQVAAKDPTAEKYFTEAYGLYPDLNDTMANGAALPTGERLARALLTKGVSINAREQNGATALLIATNRHRVPVVRYLLDLDADPNIPDRNGWTPLLSSADDGDLEIVSLLLAKGADPRTKMRDNDAAAMAERKGHKELAAMLRERAAAAK